MNEKKIRRILKKKKEKTIKIQNYKNKIYKIWEHIKGEKYEISHFAFEIERKNTYDMIINNEYDYLEFFNL